MKAISVKQMLALLVIIITSKLLFLMYSNYDQIRFQSRFRIEMAFAGHLFDSVVFKDKMPRIHSDFPNDLSVVAYVFNGNDIVGYVSNNCLFIEITNVNISKEEYARKIDQAFDLAERADKFEKKVIDIAGLILISFCVVGLIRISIVFNWCRKTFAQ